MRVIVFGQTGQVARELMARAPADMVLTALGRDKADLSDPAACAAVVQGAAVDAVINAATIIPPRKNTKSSKTLAAAAAARNEALRASRYLGRALWRRWSGYQRRGHIESKMHFVKLLGQRLMAQDFDRQVAEFQVRVAVLIGFTAPGIPVTKVAG
jgi:hypothetical protein